LSQLNGTNRDLDALFIRRRPYCTAVSLVLCSA
jgi:hypothetical protein